jgi:hypothetical protein
MPGWRASAACFTILGALDLGSDEGAARAARAVSAARATKADHRTLTRIMLGLASQASGAARRRLLEVRQFPATAPGRASYSSALPDAGEGRRKQDADHCTLSW